MDAKVSYTLFVYISISVIVQGYSSTTSIDDISDLNFTQIIKNHGYRSEQHTIVTEDGYILTVFRILLPEYCFGNTKKLPVFLMHGVLLSADAWIVSGPKTGLGYLLANLCFDVWIGNVRGNFYSRKHIRYDPDKNLDFWNFSHTEFGVYDLPAVIDHILETTGLKMLNYIGFSQGAGTFYIMCSERPQYCDKVNLMIALAPSTRHLYTRSSLFRLGSELVLLLRDNLEESRVGELLAKGSIFQDFLALLCQYSRSTKIFCDTLKDVVDSIHSLHPGFVSERTLTGMFQTFPAGTSVQNVAHFGQLVSCKEFLKYDFGRSKNVEVYGTDRPPAYNFSAVTVPVLVIYGLNDGIVDPRDVLWSTNKLPNVLEMYSIKKTIWTHFDVLYSRFTKELLLPKVSEYLFMYSVV